MVEGTFKNAIDSVANNAPPSLGLSVRSAEDILHKKNQTRRQLGYTLILLTIAVLAFIAGWYLETHRLHLSSNKPVSIGQSIMS